MNCIHRVIWNSASNAWQAVSETATGKTRSSRARRAAALGALLFSGAALAQLPTGGQITSGAGSISQSGQVMTITQSSDRLSADWQSFGIGQGHTVNFVQPGASSIALNRVLGSDVSRIQGALNANGQVFLINPNGVLLSPSAQVNVGGLLASTLDIDANAFQAGRLQLSGSSTQAVHNQGVINAAQGGTIALVAARIVNDGELNAPQGQVLLGAGSRVTLDLGGPVKIEVANEQLETLIHNGGAIRAQGGTVWLTSQAADRLTSSVINHSGVIEAQAMQQGPAGEVILFAHGGDMRLAGAIDAEGGFVETSGKHFSVAPGASVRAADWLIDPVNVTIDATLAGTIQTALGAGHVTVTTDGGNTPDTSGGESAGDGDITVNHAITWSTGNRLTLSAHQDIHVNADITASHASAGVIFLYGQGVADGSGAVYRQASGATVSAASQQWRKGSDAAALRYGIVNGDVFLGGRYVELGLALNSLGGKFGTTHRPSLFFGRQGNRAGVGMVGDADGFGQGQDLRIDYFLPGTPEERFSAGYDLGGSFTQAGNFANAGNNARFELIHPEANQQTVGVTMSATLGGNLEVAQHFTLATEDKYFRNEVTLRNVGGGTLNDVGFSRSFDPDNTQDMGGGYDTTQRIELTRAAGDSANVVSATSQAGDAYATAAGGSQSKIIYYTADDNTAVGFGSNFFGGTLSSQRSTAAGQAKGDSVHADVGIGVIFNAGTLGAGQSASFSYLTSLDNRDMATILAELGQATGAARPSVPQSTLPADPLVGTTLNPLPVLQQAGNTPANPGAGSLLPVPGVSLSSGGSLPVVDHIGGLAFVALSGSGAQGSGASEGAITGAPAGDGVASAPGGEAGGPALALPPDAQGVDANGFMRVFLVDGGIALPEGLGESEPRRPVAR